MSKEHPESIVFSWIEIKDGKVVHVKKALSIYYTYGEGLSLQDTSFGREILAGLKNGASPNIRFSDEDTYDINYGGDDD